MAKLNKLTMRSDLVVAGFLIAIIFMMILPLPTVVVDSIIGINMGLGVLLLIVGIYMTSPLEFLVDMQNGVFLNDVAGLLTLLL